MGDVIVTDTNIPPASSDQILVVLPYNATPTPNSRLKPDTYYSFKNTWRKLFTPIYELLKAYVPITRTITINSVEYDLSENRSWTVTAGAADLEDVLNEGNDGGGLAIENIADPTNAQDAATKAYVDNSVVDPAGSDTEVQFNDGGAFGADSTFTFNKTSKVLTIQAGVLTGGTASQLVQLDGSKNLVTSNTLPNGTVATTQAIDDDSTKVATTEYVDRYFEPDSYIRVYSEFTGFANALSANTNLDTNFCLTVVNSGSIARDTTPYLNYVGVVNMLTNANAGARVYIESLGWSIGGRAANHYSRFKIPILATGAQDFNCGTGFINTTGGISTATYAAFVYCNSTANSGNWVIQTINAGVTTTFNTAITPVADTFTTIKVEINSAGTEVRVYFDGVEPSGIGYPITTNIPASAPVVLLAATFIEKTAGTTSRTLGLDMIDTQQF